MFVGTPRTIVLAGPLGTAQMRSLDEYCHRVHGAGQTELHLDMGGVTECLRDGLDGLAGLVAGSTLLTVTVSGARWSQFTTSLSTAPAGDVHALRAAVRRLVGTSEGAPRAVGDSAEELSTTHRTTPVGISRSPARS